MSLSWRNEDAQQDDWSLAPVHATMRSGGNNLGDTTFWEYKCVTTATGQLVWYGTSNIDSGEVGFNLTLNPGGGPGGVLLTVGTGATIAHNSSAYSTIDKVGIKTAVSSPGGGVELYNVKVACYVGGVPQDSNSGCVGLTVNYTQNKPTPAVGFLCTTTNPQILECPADTTKIVVTGTVHLVASTMPSANQLRAFIYVWC